MDVAEPGPAASLSRPSSASQLERQLWEQWVDHKDGAARSALLQMYASHARMMAATYYARRFHDEIEFAEYHQLASVGMLEAFERFDPKHGVQFKTFAERRIRGAILDGLSLMTEKQQQMAARRKLEAQRSEELKAVAGPDAMSLSPDSKVLQYVAEVGLAFAIGWILDGSAMVERDEPTETLHFYRQAEMRQLREQILEVVKSLPAQESSVIHWHYLQEIGFEEIAGMLGVTRGRVSQIHRKALGRLKDLFSGPQPCNVVW